MPVKPRACTHPADQQTCSSPLRALLAGPGASLANYFSFAFDESANPITPDVVGYPPASAPISSGIILFGVAPGHACAGRKSPFDIPEQSFTTLL